MSQPSAVGDSVLQRIATKMSLVHPTEALTWATSTAPGSRLDVMLSGLVSGQMNKSEPNPKLAAALVTLISEPRVRQDAANQLVGRWRSIDATSADAWAKEAASQGRITAIAPLPTQKPGSNPSAVAGADERLRQSHYSLGSMSFTVYY